MIETVRFKILHEPATDPKGKCRPSEDQVIATLPFLGVADGTSGIHVPPTEPINFHGLTGGQMVGRMLAQSCAALSPENSIWDIITEANRLIREELTAAGLNVHQTDKTPAACFALIKIGADEIQYVCAGDCRILAIHNDRTLTITKDQVRLHDQEMYAEMRKLKEQQGPEEGLKTFFREFLPPKRLKRVNNPNCPKGYSVLNGQKKVKDMLMRGAFSREQTENLIIFTDGLTHPDETDDQRLAEQMASVHASEGLEGLVNRAGQYQRPHEKKPEMTVMEVTL